MTVVESIFATNDAQAAHEMSGEIPPMVHVLGGSEPAGLPAGSRVRRESDPFAAVLSLAADDRNVPAMLVLSLAELTERHATVVRAAKRVRPDVEVLLSDCDGKAPLLAQLVLYGADGLVGGDGIVRRFHQPATPIPERPPVAPLPSPASSGAFDDLETGAVLTAEELAALLGDDEGND